MYNNGAMAIIIIVVDLIDVGVYIISLDPLKMRTPCNGDFFTPIIVNRGGQIDARC